MNTTKANDSPLLFCDYYKQWISMYKEGAIRPVTMNKYNMAHKWVTKLVPDLCITNLDRTTYQKLLNDYAAEHEHQTTMDFHHHLKCAILDSVDEGLISKDPTRKAIIKGKIPPPKKLKYLNAPSIPRLTTQLRASLNFEAAERGSDFSSITPNAQLHALVNAMSARNRQFHQP